MITNINDCKSVHSFMAIFLDLLNNANPITDEKFV